MNKRDELTVQVSDAIRASMDGIEKDPVAVMQLGFIVLGPDDPVVNELRVCLLEPSPRGNLVESKDTILTILDREIDSADVCGTLEGLAEKIAVAIQSSGLPKRA